MAPRIIHNPENPQVPLLRFKWFLIRILGPSVRLCVVFISDLLHRIFKLVRYGAGYDLVYFYCYASSVLVYIMMYKIDSYCTLSRKRYKQNDHPQITRDVTHFSRKQKTCGTQPRRKGVVKLKPSKHVHINQFTPCTSIHVYAICPLIKIKGR